MPCLFLRNLPPDIDWQPEACRELYMGIAEAAGVTTDEIQIHLESTRYDLLTIAALLVPHIGIHVDVQSHPRSDLAKRMIASVIHRFLEDHGLGFQSDIAFLDYPTGSFYFEGQRVFTEAEKRSERFMESIKKHCL